MIRNIISDMSLLVRFTLVSFLVTVLIAAGLAWRLESTLQRDALSAVAESTADQAINVLNNQLTVQDLKSALAGERYEEIDGLIHDSLLSPNIVRMKIWNPEGMLIYSDDQNTLGQTFPLTHEMQEALNGKMATEISRLDAAENISERGLYTELFEIYVPLRPEGSNEILGIYEVYYDLSRLSPRLTRIRYTVWSGVGVAFLLLYGALFALIRNASRELVQRNKENQVLLANERRERELAGTLERVSQGMSEILDLRRLLDLICRESVEVFNTDAAFLWLLEGGELIGFAAYGTGTDQFIGMRFPIYDPQLLGARVARERKPILVNDAVNSKDVDQNMIRRFAIQSMMGIPLIKGERVLGALMIMDSDSPARFNGEDLDTASVFGRHAAMAIDNAQLYERARTHLAHERALREIDLAITSNLDLSLILQVVLGQTRKQLRVDACAILLLDSDLNTLNYARGLGFQTELIKNTHLRLGEGRAGNAALERRTLGRSELESPDQIPDRAGVLAAENIAAYFIAPLVAREKLLGVLEIYHRAPLTIKTEWLKFLETLAGQTAIAIENATLFENLQRSNNELELAYDATIEGWSAALDLRDKETEGHTQRVTEMTLRLAEKMGFSPQELVQVRRGALLHDIGKMGVPDRILLKTDVLTRDEWEIMKMHPTYAYQLLKPTAYLGPALDIPYCHHEKWEGTGYPRGLKGEEIPMAARIFCVVDVYDTLTSDRPYRKGWNRERALAYIREQADQHFDPRVVASFIDLLSDEKEALSQREGNVEE